jgi:uncharacterized membrane protein (UPF0182 family)
MKIKTTTKVNSVISIILSLFFSIKGSINYGWFSCMGLREIQKCSFFNWLFQIVILFIVFLLIIIGIEYGAKYLYKSYSKKTPEEPEKVEEKQAPKEEKTEEEPKKKVIKI